ncbi:hypothetical protein V5799_016542 [Amblyomma americanum]|uniref:Uncharacterized protein n=1 Tax=Amblyomma americanum TaxID=6943 RepID=A0AAQ4F4U0_AMBAM
MQLQLAGEFLRGRRDGFTLEAAPAYPHGTPALSTIRRLSSLLYRKKKFHRLVSQVFEFRTQPPVFATGRPSFATGGPSFATGGPSFATSGPSFATGYLRPPGCGIPLRAEYVALSALSLARSSVASSRTGMGRLVPAVVAA